MSALLPGFVPWPEELAMRYRALGLWEGRTLFETVAGTAARSPLATAVVHGAMRVDYATLVGQSEWLAAGLFDLGLRALDRVVLQLPNGIDFVRAYLALCRIGAIPVMALRAHRHTEVEHFIRASGAVAYLIPDVVARFDYRPMALEMQGRFPDLRHVVVAGEAALGQCSLASLLDGRRDARPGDIPRPDPSNVATMLLSGGTTSMSKLIPRTHDDYALNARLCAAAGGFDASTVLMSILPLGHNYNLASPGMLGVFRAGGTLVVAEGTDTEHLFELVTRERVNVVAAVVPLISNWLQAEVSRRHDVSSLRVVQNGGARLAPGLRARLREAFGCTPQEIYGTAEGLINMTRLDDDDETLLHSSGRPVSELDEIRVVGDDDLEVADGEAGELVTRGPYTIRGYYDAPAKNTEAFMPGGWYRMGDVVRKRGRVVYAEGRRKDLINRGGEKINCDEVESLIYRHPAVKVVALVPMPDPLFGEKACACVVLQPGASLDLAALVAFLREQRIASFKLPERLEVLEEFPLSPVGKIVKRQLREIVEQRMAADARHPG
ncbi:MAG TPA: AMP-binding protein [Caldimonas sp.]|nr:AMP-binding protein [Caldimonas sp.]